MLNTNQYFSLSANNYIAYMDFALWQIPEKAIDMRKESGVGLSEMISVHPHQDSLRFLAEHSKFYLENTLLESFLELQSGIVFLLFFWMVLANREKADVTPPPLAAGGHALL